MIAPTYIYRVAEVLAVHDGDTYRLRLDLGFGAQMVVTVRLHRWNAPELATPDGPKARDAALGFLKTAQAIVVQSYKDDRSFERWVCDVYCDGDLLGARLEAAGLAVVMAKHP
jgi:hypothetical protein